MPGDAQPMVDGGAPLRYLIVAYPPRPTLTINARTESLNAGKSWSANANAEARYGSSERVERCRIWAMITSDETRPCNW